MSSKQIKEFSVKLLEAKQEILKDHEGEIPLHHDARDSDTDSDSVSSEDHDTDKESDSDAHEIGEPDEKHRLEPGGGDGNDH